MPSTLETDLQRITSVDDPAQLRDLDEIIGSVNPIESGPDEFLALLGMFERFPESDGFGVFWSIVHCLEACVGYEATLIESVNRKPVEFNVLMINRLLNAGTAEINGQSLLSILKSISVNPEATIGARADAEHFLEYQKANGRA